MKKHPMFLSLLEVTKMKSRDSFDRTRMAVTMTFLTWMLVAIIASATAPITYAQVPPSLLGTGGRLRISQAQCLSLARQAIQQAGLILAPDHASSRGGHNQYLAVNIACLSADGGVIFSVWVAGLPGYNSETVRMRDSLGTYMGSVGSSSSSSPSVGSGDGSTCWSWELKYHNGQTGRGAIRFYPNSLATISGTNSYWDRTVNWRAVGQEIHLDAENNNYRGNQFVRFRRTSAGLESVPDYWSSKTVATQVRCP